MRFASSSLAAALLLSGAVTSAYSADAPAGSTAVSAGEALPPVHITWKASPASSLYQSARGGSQSAFKKLLTLAGTGDREAEADVAVCYDDALGVQKDASQARHFAGLALKPLMDAAGHGEPVAQEQLGLFYMKGLSVTADYAQALQLYKAAAAQGDPEAMRLVGVMYQFGRGVTKDGPQGEQWYERSADAGDAFSAISIGDMYTYVGGGISRMDYPLAMKWYLRAQELGDHGAISAIGYMYQEGLGVPQDYAEAQKDYRLAAAQESKYGPRLLGQLYQKGLGVPQDDAQALSWYRQAAADGDVLSREVAEDLAKDQQLWQAARDSDVAAVTKRLAAGVDHDALSSALTQAIYAGSPEVVALLLSHGADPNEIDHYGDTPLYLAVRGGDTDVIDALLDHGALLEPRNCPGDPPLFAAIPPLRKKGEPPSDDVFVYLLGKGADVNVRDCSGKTVLHTAVATGRDDTAIRFIMLYGADPYARDALGETPYDLARMQPTENIVDRGTWDQDGLFTKVGFRELFSPAYEGAKPGFSCARAKDLKLVEKEICTVPYLSQLDHTLNDAYTAAIKAAADPEVVKKDQREWLAHLDSSCDDGATACPVGRLVGWYQRRIALLQLPPSEYAIGPVRPKPLIGSSAEERKAYFQDRLKAESQDYPSPDERQKEIPYILGALQDPDPEIRESATHRIFDEAMLPAMIHAMAFDTDPAVRLGAVLSMSSFITSNGADTCNSVRPVSEHLDELLLGLDDRGTSRYVMDILSDDAGDEPLPCCMSKELQEHVVKALTARNPESSTAAKSFSCPVIPGTLKDQ